MNCILAVTATSESWPLVLDVARKFAECDSSGCLSAALVRCNSTNPPHHTQIEWRTTRNLEPKRASVTFYRVEANRDPVGNTAFRAHIVWWFRRTIRELAYVLLSSKASVATPPNQQLTIKVRFDKNRRVGLYKDKD